MTDLWQLFGQWEEVESALHGDLKPLLALVRSDEPLTKVVRDYIADEIEREPGKRFRRQRKADLSLKRRDALLLYQVFSAKIHVALERAGPDADEATRHEAIDSAQDTISDRAALDYLSERGELEPDIDEDAIKNALRRRPSTLFIPRGRRRKLVRKAV